MTIGDDLPMGVNAPIPFPARRVYTAEEAAEVLRVRRTLMYQLLMTQRIRSLKAGGRRLVPAEAIEEFIRQGMEAAG